MTGSGEPSSPAAGARAPTSSLRGFLWRFICLCMLPLLALSCYLAFDSVRTTRASIDLDAADLANHLAAAIDQNLNARIGALRVLADSPAAGDPARHGELYRQALAFRRVYGGEVVLGDDQGRMLFNTRVPEGSPLPPLPRPVGNAAVPMALASGKPAVGDTFIGPIAQRPLVAIAVPMARNDHGAFVLLSLVEASQFQEVLARSPLPEGWSATLIDGKKETIARRSPPGAQTLAEDADHGRFVARPATSAWSLVLEIPADRYRAPWLAAARILVLFILAGTVTGALAGVLASRSLAAAVTSLTEPAAAARTPEIAEIAAARARLAESALARESALSALRDSEANFKSMFDGITDAMIFSDPARRIRMVNPAFTAMFGHVAADAVGHTSEFLYADPADYERLGRERYGNEALVTSGTYQMRYRRRDGTEFWAETSGMRILGPAGEVTALFGIHRDISRRLAAEQTHRELSERFAKVFYTSPLGIGIGRIADARFVDINPALETLLGYGREEMLGRTSEALNLWVDPLAQAAMADAVRAHGIAQNVETRFRTKSGRIIDVAFSSCRIDIGGDAHFVGMVSDITPQRQALRDQALQQEQLEAQVAQRTAELAAANRTLAERAEAIDDLYEHAPCGYFSLQRDRTITRVNQTCLDLLGYTREEFVGRVFDTLMTAESRAEHFRRFMQVVRTTRARDIEYEVVRKDGSVLPVLINADIERDAEGVMVAARVTLMSNSERKAREAQIQAMQRELARRAEEAEAANRAKSAFLAHMSHEIRTPMNAIIGLTHLLSRDAQDTLQRERVGKVGDAGRHLLQVINDILDLSKIEAGKMTLDDAEFSLDGLLTRSFEMVSGQARAKGLELILDTDHLPERLRGDQTRLSQALINLLANAVKFTDHGWVRVRGQVQGEERHRLQIRFEVQDTGAGIAPELQSELFNAFEQADPSSTRRHDGTGLGLALTRHIARMMGGDAGFESAPGAGSRFWFSAWVGRASEAGERAAPIALQGLRALVVDDLPEALRVLGDGLQQLGLQVDCVDSGSAALRHVQAELAAGRTHHVMLIDWRMPAPDGIETLKRLKQLLGAGMPPSILVTAFDDPAMWRQSRLAASDAVLVKPITASALHDALVRVLRGPVTALPAPPALPGHAEALLRRDHGGQRVLLAEDNPINQEVAEELLRSVGLTIETAGDGERAVEMALSRHYDLILMDLQMPRVDGLAATRTIRQRAGRGTPIVAMTANAFSEDRAACLQAGMNDHVPKPVDPELLYATLLRWLPLRDRPAEPGRTAPQRAADGPAEPPLPERLAGVEGLDAAAALAHVGGQPATLERMLRRFTQTYRAGAPALLAPPTEEGVAQWRVACHSMRGVCGTVGAVALNRQLAAFEQVLRESDDAAALAPQARALHEELLRLAARLTDALDR